MEKSSFIQTALCLAHTAKTLNQLRVQIPAN